jgi:hypothetical protein
MARLEPEVCGRDVFFLWLGMALSKTGYERNKTTSNHYYPLSSNIIHYHPLPSIIQYNYHPLPSITIHDPIIIQ